MDRAVLLLLLCGASSIRAQCDMATLTALSANTDKASAMPNLLATNPACGQCVMACQSAPDKEACVMGCIGAGNAAAAVPDAVPDAVKRDPTRPASTASGTMRGMRYCEILFGNCTSSWDAAEGGGCKSAQTDMASTHGLNDCSPTSWARITAPQVGSEWHASVVGLNGVRFFLMDEMTTSATTTIKSVDEFVAMRDMQEKMGRMGLMQVAGLQFVLSGQQQSIAFEPGELIIGAGVTAMAFDSRPYLLNPSSNRVNLHCKNFVAGSDVYLMRHPLPTGVGSEPFRYEHCHLCSGCCSHIAVVLLLKAPWHSPPRHGCDSHRFGMRSLAIFSIPYTVPTLGRYYGLQSVFDTNGVTSSGATDPFTGWAELPPIKGGGSALYRCVCHCAHALVLLHVRACARACLLACALHVCACECV